MSSLVFPSGLITRAGYQRVPVHDVQTQLSLSQKRWSQTWSSYPLTEYRLKLEHLRSDAQYQEFQQVVTFVARHLGPLDSFLFSDQEDNVVTDHGFGVGDGATTVYQLQRTLGGSYSDELGTYSQSSKPRTNYCQWSQAQAGHWSPNFGGEILVNNAAIAPDGTVTATSLTAGGVNAGMFIDNSLLAGKSLVTCSCWARVASGTKTGSLIVTGVSSTGMVVTATWQRFSFTYSGAPITSGSHPTCVTFGGAAGDVVYYWGFQVEDGSVATQYVPTTSAAASSVPDYWPLMGDGFEPVHEMRQVPTSELPSFTDPAQQWAGTRTPYGYQRTNLCSWSQAFDKWTLTNCAAVADTGTAPDGTGTADRLTASGAATATETVTGLTAGASYVFSAWVRCAAGTTLKLGSTEGASAAQAVTATSQRLTWAFTAAGASTTVSVGAGGSWTTGVVLECWGAQVEPGSTPTAYIPTQGDLVTVPAEYEGSPTLWQDGDWQGRRRLYATARTNLLPYSQALGSWSSTTGITFTSDLVAAPDGTMTADRVVYSGAGTSGNYRFYITGAGSLVVGQTYTTSIWLRADAPLSLVLGDSMSGLATVSITTSWQRFAVTSSATAANSVQLLIYSPAGVNTGFTVYAWGAQKETSPFATSYISTAAAAVTVTDYTLGANGLVTLSPAPPLGAFLSWTGGHYKRVRLNTDRVPADLIVAQLWKTGEIQLITVKP
jgi:hypothetical protein